MSRRTAQAAIRGTMRQPARSLLALALLVAAAIAATSIAVASPLTDSSLSHATSDARHDPAVGRTEVAWSIDRDSPHDAHIAAAESGVDARLTLDTHGQQQPHHNFHTLAGSWSCTNWGACGFYPSCTQNRTCECTGGTCTVAPAPYSPRARANNRDGSRTCKGEGARSRALRSRAREANFARSRA